MTVTHSAVIPVKETTERFSSVKIDKILKHDVSLTRITRANTARSWQFRYQRVGLSLPEGNVQQNCALCTTRLSQRWEHAKVTQPNQDRTTQHRTTNRVSKDRARRHEYKDINKYGVRLNSKKLQRFELLEQTYLRLNSFTGYKYDPIYTKIAEHTETTHTRGNVQQYLKKVIRNQRYDHSKLTIQIQDFNMQKYYNVNKQYVT